MVIIAPRPFALIGLLPTFILYSRSSSSFYFNFLLHSSCLVFFNVFLLVLYGLPVPFLLILEERFNARFILGLFYYCSNICFSSICVLVFPLSFSAASLVIICSCCKYFLFLWPRIRFAPDVSQFSILFCHFVYDDQFFYIHCIFCLQLYGCLSALVFLPFSQYSYLGQYLFGCVNYKHYFSFSIFLSGVFHCPNTYGCSFPRLFLLLVGLIFFFSHFF